MRRTLAIGAALLLGVAACGGSSDDATDNGGDGPGATDTPTAEDGSASATVPPADAGESGGDESGGDESGDAEGSGPSTATVTIDGVTYDFSSEGAMVAQCLTDLFGIFAVQLTAADGGDGAISLFILHDDTDPSVVEEHDNIEVDDGDESWIADEDSDLFDMSDQLQSGMTQVDTAQIDGSTVSGTATFVKQSSVFGGGEIETATGTFEATCGEERTT